MAGKLDVYSLGSLGVNTDKNPLELEDGELFKSQNAIHDPLGSLGGLRKRAGLVKLNSVAAAGAINGAIGVPLLVGSAGDEVPAVTPDSGVFSLFLGRRITSATSGWNTTNTAFASSVTTGGPDGYAATATPIVPDRLTAAMFAGELAGQKALYAVNVGSPCAMYKNRFYYAGNDYTLGTTPPTLHMWDGATDYRVAVLPTRAGVQRQGILNILATADALYLVSYDSGSTSASTLLVTLFSFDPQSNALTQLGSLFPIAGQNVPFKIGWSQNRLWVRTFTTQSGDTNYRTYYLRPGIDTDWTLDETVAAANRGCSDILQFNGQTFFAMREGAASTTGAVISVRSTLGVYSTSKQAQLNEGSGTVIGSFASSNQFCKLITFQGNLYASYWDDDASHHYSRIYKFDGSTWTLVYSSAQDGSTAVPLVHAAAIGGKLHFFSSSEDGRANLIEVILQSPDGTTWTDVSASPSLAGTLIQVVGNIIR